MFPRPPAQLRALCEVFTIRNLSHDQRWTCGGCLDPFGVRVLTLTSNSELTAGASRSFKFACNHGKGLCVPGTVSGAGRMHKLDMHIVVEGTGEKSLAPIVIHEAKRIQ
jgi:hypothetical protein